MNKKSVLFISKQMQNDALLVEAAANYFARSNKIFDCKFQSAVCNPTIDAVNFTELNHAFKALEMNFTCPGNKPSIVSYQILDHADLICVIGNETEEWMKAYYSKYYVEKGIVLFDQIPYETGKIDFKPAIAQVEWYIRKLIRLNIGFKATMQSIEEYLCIANGLVYKELLVAMTFRCSYFLIIKTFCGKTEHFTCFY